MPQHQHLTLLVDSAASTDVRAAQALTPMLAQAGIKVEVQPVAASSLARRLASGDYQMALRTLAAQTPTPADPLQQLVTGHYLVGAASVSAADTALQAVETAAHQSGAKPAVTAFEQQAFATAAAVPLVDPDVVDVVSKKVQGLALLPSGIYHASGLWLKK